MQATRALLSAFMLSACVHTEALDVEELGTSRDAWGHLSSSGLTPSAPQFLINKDVGKPYRVCLASYMTTLYPGFEIELDAAINAWGVYLGRAIPVEIVTKDLPRATAADTVDTVLTKYTERCGQGFDTVVGLAPLPNNAVGITSSPYTYFTNPDGSHRVASFKRGVFLKDYDIQPTERLGIKESWISLRQGGFEFTSARALLDAMARRDTVAYEQESRFLAFPVLTHEFGHVWGMCDQYEGASNCDPVHSTSHINEDSIMSSRSSRQRLYLTDDDVEGIRKLAGRPGYAHQWGTPAALTATPPAEVRRPLELARVERVTLDDATLKVRYSVVTTRKTKYEFAIKGEGQAQFWPLRSSYEEDNGVEAVNAGLDIRLSNTPAASYQVRLRVGVANDDGTFGAPETWFETVR